MLTMNPLKLNNLLSRIVADNDQRAFSMLFDHYHTRLLNLAMLFVTDYNIAEEVVSDVFFKILKKKEELPAIEKFEGYLFKMVKNYALNSLKQRSKERLHVRIDEIEDYMLPEDCNPEKKLVNKNLGEYLNQAINDLPPKRRLVFKMVKDERMSYREVAEILEISERTVEVHLKLAISDLRKVLQTYYDEHRDIIPLSNRGFLSLFL